MVFGKLHKPNAKAHVNVAKYLCDWTHQVSKPQKFVKDFLYPYWRGCVVLEEFRIPGSLLRIDLLNLSYKIAVEVSPAGSHSFNKFFHVTNLKFGAAMERELDKAEWIKQNGFQMVEIFEDDLKELSKEWFKTKYNIDL